MAEDVAANAMSRRQLIARDSLAFLSLTLITLVLLGVTLFLFRSFMAHRAELSVRWGERGRAALAQGKPAEAVAAYRAALSYAPDEHADELMLARALGEAGRTEESYNYFMELWEQRPGDGFVNLQLARLNVKRRDVQEAINSYRASIYGTWEGDGVERRREVRLELARYLLEQHETGAARSELLIAGGNAPDTAPLDVMIGKLLEQAGASSDAMGYYEKAVAKEPGNDAALRGAGRLSFALGDYGRARKLLRRALRSGEEGADATLLAQTERLLQLEPSDRLSTKERVDRILVARKDAKLRLDACMAPSAESAGTAGSSLQQLRDRWTTSAGTSDRRTLLQDEEKQGAALQLAYDTELATNQVCVPATGDDSLLVLLAKAAATRDK